MFLFEVDGCANYRILSEADRAQGNAVKNNLCDDGLKTGWYRFQGAAGDRMADKCVPNYRCGTYLPGWLLGSHPTVAEGVVTLKVCYNYFQVYCRCMIPYNIKVKNCGSYYVYELVQKPPYLYCPYRYCGNARAGKLYSK